MWCTSNRAAIALLAVALFLLFWRLGSSSFHSGDEAVYAQCAREMIERSDYLTPYYGGDLFLEKPPAKMWLIAAGYRLLGINEWGARLSSAIFALGTVAATVLLGRALFGIGPALLAGAILVSSVQFVHEHCGRTAEMEPETAFLFTMGMILVLRTSRDPRWASALGLVIGCLILVKGPIALPVFGVATLYLWWCRPLPPKTWQHLILGGVVMLAVATPWHAYLLATNGDLFREIYVEGHVLGRVMGLPPDPVASTVKGLHAAPRPFFYPKVLFFSMFPWSLLALPAVLLALVVAARQRSREVRLLVLWFLVFAAMITLANGKLPWYTVPILPAVALIVAWFVSRLRGMESPLILYGGGTLVLAVSLFLMPSPDYHPYSREATLWPFRDRSLVAATELARWEFGSWLPLATSAVLLAGAATVILLSRRKGRSTVMRVMFGRFVIGSLLLTGLCHVALPLRGADNRDDFARPFANCSEALKERGLVPNRLLILDERTLALALKWTSFFYVYELSGGGGGSMARLRVGPQSWQDPQILRAGTVLIGRPRWAAELKATGRVEEVWAGSTLFAGYVRP